MDIDDVILQEIMDIVEEKLDYEHLDFIQYMHEHFRDLKSDTEGWLKDVWFDWRNFKPGTPEDLKAAAFRLWKVNPGRLKQIHYFG